jgi:hypothetical protein
MGLLVVGKATHDQYATTMEIIMFLKNKVFI